MPKHTKPTQQQLDENIDNAAKDLEKLDPNAPDPNDESLEAQKPDETSKKDTPEPEEEDKASEDDSEGEEDDTQDEKQNDTGDEEPEEEEVAPSPDYKKRYVESTKEAQILSAKNRKVTEALEESQKAKDPTEEELKNEYSEWDVMSETEKKLARDNLRSSKRFEALDNITKEIRNIDVWTEKVEKYLDDPKTLTDNPQLEGQTEEFKIFATKPTRQGVDFEDLVSAFSFDITKTKAVKSRKKMFEKGSSGLNEKSKPKSDKISFEEATALKETNYDRYIEKLKTGKIEPPDF